METLSALLAICARNSPVIGEFPSQRPETRSFDVFLDLRPNKRVNNRKAGDLRRHRAHHDVTVMMMKTKKINETLQMKWNVGLLRGRYRRLLGCHKRETSRPPKLDHQQGTISTGLIWLIFVKKSRVNLYHFAWWRHQMETFSALLAMPFVREIHRSHTHTHKGQWCGGLMFPLICVWMTGWVNNREAGDLRHHRAHYDVTIMDCRAYTCTANITWEQ